MMINRLIFISLAMLLLVGCPGPSTPQGPDVGPGDVKNGTPPALEVMPVAAPAGSEHTLILSSFNPNELVILEVISAETEEVVFQTEVQVDEEGFGETVFASDPGQQPGVYLVIATGQESDTVVRSELEILPGEQ